ncbi:MAG: NAD(P)-binding protein [Pseudomonadota bacterium]
MARSSIFIIGAGVAGLACGRVLADAGFDVRLADKGRGPGGRCSTRRSEVGRFDHGAPCFTASDPRFTLQVEAWQAAGVAEEWKGSFRDRNNQPSELTRYVGVPSMNAFVRHDADALGAQFGLQMGRPKPAGAGFDLYTADGQSIGAADFVVIATPAPQAASLLPDPSPLQRHAATTPMIPCWTLMAAFDEGAVIPSHDMRTFADQPIETVIWQGGRPGRDPGARLVAHATSEWATEHLEDDAETVAAALEDALKLEARATFRTAHRWRYARAVLSDGPRYSADLAAGLAVCGDWHAGPNVEDAWLSGHELGQHLAAALA